MLEKQYKFHSYLLHTNNSSGTVYHFTGTIPQFEEWLKNNSQKLLRWAEEIISGTTRSAKIVGLEIDARGNPNGEEKVLFILSKS